jgi:hypothetical protein
MQTTRTSEPTSAYSMSEAPASSFNKSANVCDRFLANRMHFSALLFSLEDLIGITGQAFGLALM